LYRGNWGTGPGARSTHAPFHPSKGGNRVNSLFTDVNGHCSGSELQRRGARGLRLQPLRSPSGGWYSVHADGSAPDAVGLAQRLVNRPRPLRAGREVRGVACLKLEAAAVLCGESRVTSDEVAKLRVDYCARESAGRRLPGTGLDGTVWRRPGFDATERRSRQATDWWRHAAQRPGTRSGPSPTVARCAQWSLKSTSGSMRGRSLAWHFDPEVLTRKAASAFLLRRPNVRSADIMSQVAQIAKESNVTVPNPGRLATHTPFRPSSRPSDSSTASARDSPAPETQARYAIPLATNFKFASISDTQ